MNYEERVIRADYTPETITVYQAYRSEIALPAVQHQTFVPPFKMERMTWIKPSFLWMMYRSGWARKAGQEHVLALEIKREGWEWALANACLSHYTAGVHASPEAWKATMQAAPVRVQWDPEKDIHLQNLPYRSIQVGLSGIAVDKYVNEWIVSITDISNHCRQVHELILKGRTEEAKTFLPEENIYPLPEDIRSIVRGS